MIKIVAENFVKKDSKDRFLEISEKLIQETRKEAGGKSYYLERKQSMSNFKEIDFSPNPFEMIGKQWMLITAEKDQNVNTMTASWGGMGVLWGENVVYIFVRESRYTKEFLDATNYFSLSFFEEEYKKKLGYLGHVSGRDENKIEKAGLTIAHEKEIPYFSEAETVILCKKLSKHFIDPKGILEKEILHKWYEDYDFHNMYVGKIVNIKQGKLDR